jgi:type IV secretion system protein VirD4
MVSRSETARPLMTPGEVMQLPATDEIVMVAGAPPIRAKKARYFEDRRLAERILPTPTQTEDAIIAKPDDWSALAPVHPSASVADASHGDERASANVARTDGNAEDDPANAGLRREPGLERHKDIAPEPIKPAVNEFDPETDQRDDDAIRVRALVRNVRSVARQVSLDPGDGMEL